MCVCCVVRVYWCAPEVFESKPILSQEIEFNSRGDVRTHIFALTFGRTGVCVCVGYSG